MAQCGPVDGPPRGSAVASRHTIFVSQIVGQPMRDETGDRIATIQDVIVRLGGNDAYPPVTGLVVESTIATQRKRLR